MASINTLFKNPLVEQDKSFNLAANNFSSVIETLYNLINETTSVKDGKILFVDQNNAKLMYQLSMFDKYTSVSSPINSFQMAFPDIDGLDFMGVITFPTLPTICVFHNNLSGRTGDPDKIILMHANLPRSGDGAGEDKGKITHVISSKLSNIPEIPPPPPPPQRDPEI